MNPLLYELPLVFMSGILGSAHCIGMCGPISATMNIGTSTLRGALARQSSWSCGRVVTYAFLGMVAGFAGARFTQSSWLSSQTGVMQVQAGFAVIAGFLLVIQGLLATGWLRRKQANGGSCLTASVFGRFLQGGSSISVFIAGLATGFLPCGLVYSFLALAAASASVWKGPLIMISFGLGTVPVMLVAGAGLTMTTLTIRQRLMKVAAACVLMTGILTMGRGIVFAANSTVQTPEEACPLCSPQAEEPSGTVK